MDVCVEGTIGSGKSTLLSSLARIMKGVASVHPEPVSEWEDVLEKFYKDPASHSFALQMRVLSHFLTSGCESGSRVRIFERSYKSCRYVFGDMLAEDELMSPGDSKTFVRFCDNSFGVGSKLPFCIFVSCTFGECMQRSKARGRSDDQLVDTAYMLRLFNKYNEFIKVEDDGLLRARGLCWASSPHFKHVIALDGDRGKDELARLAAKAIDLFIGAALVEA